MLYSFGASVQDAAGGPALKSKQTLEALKFFKALYEEAMTEAVLGWDPTSNNRAMLAGETSLTVDAASITRTGEAKGMPVSDKLWLDGVPQGPAARLSPTFGMRVYAIWKFAENIEVAKRFLADQIGLARELFLISKFEDISCFLGLIPDLAQLVASDSRANPPDKYKLLQHATDWSVNMGYPGYTNAAVSEVFYSGLIPKMFAHAATGKMTVDEALVQADQEVRRIFAKWRELGKI